MTVSKQQILNPRKLRAARFLSRLNGNFRPPINANAPIMADKIKKILVQEHQCIGDVLMLEPTLYALRRAFSNAVLDLVCVPAVKELAERAELSDRVLAFPKELPLDETYDIVFDFHGDIRRLKTLKQFNSTYYAGFSFSGGAAWLTHVTDYPYADHQVERPFSLLRQMNIKVDRRTPQLSGFDPGVPASGKILLHPGANHAGRQWPAEHWSTLIDMLLDDKRDIIWITPPGEKAPEGIPEFSGCLTELAELIACSSLLVGCDSMSVHLASALGVKALAIFGSQDPELTKPYGPDGYVIFPEEPCRHRKRDWRLCEECMKSVKPAEVLMKINAII